MALKHTRIYQPDPTKPQPGSFEAEHVDEMGNPPPLWVYGGADGKTIVGIKKPDGSLVDGGGIIVSAIAPNNADGRPDGTIYIQTV
ncbi:hypothetical protein [Rhodoferax sp. WC2427]|uniref:hypothetical protein n=1 Tax=Rhodoferax sp. WC2427 TaxID=3234144 RepID=UPI00346667F8